MMAESSDLTANAVTKRFGGLTAVSDASITVRSGRIHGLIGPNGAGKSTMIGLITGFIRPDGGRIAFAGRDLARLPPAAIARLGVSRTFQQAAPLLGLTVLENVIAGMHVRYRSGIGAVLLRLPAMRREARELADAARLLLDRVGLDDEAGMQAGTLTFGKLRFLEIARAMAMRPRILLFDEPAAGLNPPESQRLAAIVRELRSEKVGILLVDHDVPLMFDLCDELTVMDSGRVIAAGDPDRIYNDPLVRAAYLGTSAAAAEAV